MNADIESLLDQVLSIVQDAPGIVAGLSDERFYQKPAPGQWSIGECFEHLNLTARQFERPILQAIETARRSGWLSNGPFSYRLIERWFIRNMEPPPKRRLRARPGFRPEEALGSSQLDGGKDGSVDSSRLVPRPSTAVMEEFYRWQDRLRELIREADGVDLRKTRLRSPVVPVFSYSLGTCFTSILAHERRHLWQARQVRKTIG